MECVLGIKCNDFVILAADTIAARSIFTMKHDQDKMFKVNTNTVMAVVGDAGDAVQFSEYIAKNVQLYKMKNGYELSPNATANFTRRFLAEYLRSRTPYHVNMLIGGFDKNDGPSLYYMDYLSSMVDLPFAVHGYSSFFSLSVMDRYYRPDMTKTEALNLVQMCLDEIHTRFIVNLASFKVRVIDKDGIQDLPDLHCKFVPSIIPVTEQGDAESSTV